MKSQQNKKKSTEDQQELGGAECISRCKIEAKTLTSEFVNPLYCALLCFTVLYTTPSYCTRRRVKGEEEEEERRDEEVEKEEEN
jgi:hypothetical protein